MLLYHNTFENTKTMSFDFPIEDQYWASEKEAIIADGITRDPIGVSDLNSKSPLEMIQKYPRPSGAELAAKEIVKTFETATESLKERLIECNKKVSALNKKYIKECDYLENDYYAAVASAIEINNQNLNYAFICDCGVIVYDRHGKIKFQTEDEKELYSDPYINRIGIPWNLPEARVIVRRDFRNNLNNIQNNRCVSYGAITGEETAIEFIRTGSIELDEGDLVLLYSDGFAFFLHEQEFINQILNFDRQAFETYIEELSKKDYNKYGKEKTLVLYKVKNLNH